MKNLRFAVPAALGLCLVTIACQSEGTTASKPTTSDGGQVIARVGSREITVGEIDGAIESDLARLEMERYRARKAKLDEMITEELVTQKAKSLGISTDELRDREVMAKVEPPDDATVRGYFERFQQQGQKVEFDEIAPRIREALTQQAAQARRDEFVASLRKEAGVDVTLEPPRMEVATGGGVSTGPKGAPITLVEFSDYQCPFCARSQDTVKQVLDRYQGKIQHVFMDFPLESIHPMAKSAASAARCADEQGKFWDYHKLLYDRQHELSPDSYRKWAEELTLDGEKFATCMDSGKYDAVIQANVDVGRKAGVTGTPGFFVNGIMINGAQPFNVFEETIDDELAG